MSTVRFETIRSQTGDGHYIDDYRCGGSKPCGGAEVAHSVKLYARDIVAALEQSKAGKAALDAYTQRAAQAAQGGEHG